MFSLLFGLLDLVILLAMGIFVYSEYKRGFPKLKGVYEGASKKLLRLSGQKEDSVERAEFTLKDYAQIVGKLEKAVSEVEADIQQNHRRAAEEADLANRSRELEKEALRKGEKETASLCASLVVHHNKRAELYENNAQKSEKIIDELQKRLDQSQMQFEMVRTQVETIRVQSHLAAANRQTYHLISGIDASKGLTPTGELKQLILQTEHDQLSSESLVTLAQKRETGKIEVLQLEEEVEKELEDTRNLISLPAATEAVN